MENIHLPLHAVVHGDVAGFVDQGRHAHGQHAFGIRDRNRVLHFQAGDTVTTPLHRECGEIPSNSNSNAFLGVCAQITLRQTLRLPNDLISPGFPDEEKFAFDFKRFAGWINHGVGFLQRSQSSFASEAAMKALKSGCGWFGLD